VRPVAQLVKRKTRPVVRAVASSRRVVRAAHTVRKVRHTVVKSTQRARKSNTAVRGGMGAVLAFARSQIGKPYVRNADGPGSYDCSGFTMRAYARAGIRLPHQSGAQAAMAYPVSRSQARPGDLVVGPGHVGIYAGGGMMYDAGNPRVDVSYRRVYGGLSIRRLR
jgi:cell wall-associated NlpC family hydrolase